jgi:DNA-binding NtrC family response regulator
MEGSPWDVAIVSSRLENRQDVAGMLFRLGIDPICISSVEQCREVSSRQNLGLVFCDRHVKDGDYRDVLSAVSPDSADRSPKVVMMSDLGSVEEYQQVRRNGIFDVISSPCRPTDVEWMVILAKRYSRRQTKELAEPTRNLSLLWKAAGAGT